jgi:hypothetical protein
MQGVQHLLQLETFVHVVYAQDMHASRSKYRTVQRHCKPTTWMLVPHPSTLKAELSACCMFSGAP